jgi:O-antigen/teichoic acid export membrane protein
MNFSHIINLSTSRVARHLTLVFTGNIVAAFLGFLTVLLISRELPVNSFGLFNIAISVMLIASRLASLGMDTGMIRFASSYLVSERSDEAHQVLSLTLLVRVVVSFVVAAIIFSASQVVSEYFFHYSNLVPLMKLAAFGIVTLSLVNYLRSALYAYQWFKRSAILQLLVDFGKICSAVMCVYFLRLDDVTSVMIFAFAPLLGIVVGRWSKDLFKRLFSYSKWLFVSNVSEITLPYVGIFMLAKMLDSESVGIYGLALNLTYIFPIIIYSLQSVLLPEVSRFTEVDQFEKYIKGSLKISFYIGIIIIPVLFLSHKIILLFFGVRYLDSVPIFNWLLLGYVVHIIKSTIRMALYSMNRPHVLAAVDMLKLIIITLGCYVFIPYFGILAPAIILLIVNVTVLSFLASYVFVKIRYGDIVLQDEEVTGTAIE